MRRLEDFEYDCPVCAAQLYPYGTDFPLRHNGSGETKTTYKCTSCGEMWSYVEKAAVASEDKSPPMDCQFCGQKCHYLSLNDDWSDYWRCVPCKVSYEQRFDPIWRGVQTINIYTTIKGNVYVLRQRLDKGVSRIEMLPEDLDETVVVAREFPFLIPNINPSNIQNKLLTYLTFT